MAFLAVGAKMQYSANVVLGFDSNFMQFKANFGVFSLRLF